MKSHHEKLLIGVLAGLVVAGAAVFAVQPAMAAGYDIDAPARVVGVHSWDQLNVRKWPAPYSQQTGALQSNAHVWVERCIIAPTGGSDWCLVEADEERGWVNARYLELAYDTDI
jgi:uncharacterized protein YraI